MYADVRAARWLRGKRTYGYRSVEELLTPDEQALLAAAWPRGATREENRRAARALWTWTKLAWREAERVMGRPLDREVDETEMLAAIDRMYMVPSGSLQAPGERRTAEGTVEYD